MSARFDLQSKTNTALLWVTIQFMLLVLTVTESYGESEACAAAWAKTRETGLSHGRICEFEQQSKQARPLKDKACSETSCVYRLRETLYRERGWRGLSTVYYSGSGYKFFPDGTVFDNVNNARVIDPRGRATYVGYEGEDYHHHKYLSGPLKGIRVDMVAGGWVLTVPK